MLFDSIQMPQIAETSEKLKCIFIVTNPELVKNPESCGVVVMNPEKLKHFGQLDPSFQQFSPKHIVEWTTI